MDTSPKEVAVPDWLLSELEQSRETLAAGRVYPAAPILAEIRARALGRIARKRARLDGQEQDGVQAD